MSKPGFTGEPMKLELHLDDGATGKYPRVYVYNDSNLLVDDLVMAPSGTNGTYTAVHTPATPGYFHMEYKVFTSNLYNIMDVNYNIPFESAYVSDRSADMAALAATVAPSVWDVSLSGHLTSGTTGKALGDAAAGGGGSGGGFPPELTVERIERLDNLDVLVSTRATQASVNSVLAALSSIAASITSIATNALTAAQVWAFPTRGLTEQVSVNNVDLSQLATKADLDAAVIDIMTGLHVWEAKGSVSMQPSTDSLELVAWLVKNGEVVLDADTASVELRDGDDNVVMPLLSDPTTTVSGLFKFTRSGASAIILKNRTYVMKITITRGVSTYLGNVSISTY